MNRHIVLFMMRKKTLHGRDTFLSKIIRTQSFAQINADQKYLFLYYKIFWKKCALLYNN